MHPKSLFRAAVLVGAVVIGIIALFSTGIALAEELPRSSALTSPNQADGTTTEQAPEILPFPKRPSGGPTNKPQPEPGTSATNQQNSHCEDTQASIQREIQQSFFKNIAEVTLYIEIPNRYDLAVKCHGNENECLSKDTHYSTQEMRAKYLHRLADDYREFPSALRKDNLARLFSDALKRDLMPFVRRGPTCDVPGLKVLTDGVSSVGLKRDVDEVTATVKVEVQEFATSKIAILHVSLSRPDRCGGTINSDSLGSLALPLSESDTDISQMLNTFMSSHAFGPNVSVTY